MLLASKHIATPRAECAVLKFYGLLFSLYCHKTCICELSIEVGDEAEAKIEIDRHKNEYNVPV